MASSLVVFDSNDATELGRPEGARLSCIMHMDHRRQSRPLESSRGGERGAADAIMLCESASVFVLLGPLVERIVSGGV